MAFKDIPGNVNWQYDDSPPNPGGALTTLWNSGANGVRLNVRNEEIYMNCRHTTLHPTQASVPNEINKSFWEAKEWNSTYINDDGAPAAAYSLRNLTGKNSNVVRVRRESDNSEKDFNSSGVSSGELVNWVNKDSASSSAASGAIYDSFDYPSGGYLKHQSTGGQNWKNSGGWDGTSGESWRITGTGKSLFYGQGSGLGLVIDNTNHIWCESQVDNYRDFLSPISTSSTYCTMLVRAYDSRPYDPSNTGTAADVVKFRIEFYDGTDATGNMRMNVGINQGTLFANTNSTGYAPSGSATSAGAFEDDKTYLLAMKRTGSGVFASLIEADGNPATLDSEPTWQINDAGLTGVNFQSMRLFGNNTDPSNFRGIRVDELRIADSWEDAVEGITTPTSTVNGFVETWYDQSGNGNDATQLTAGNQPKIVNAGALVQEGGNASLEFDGVDDYLVTTQGYIVEISQNPASVFAVANPDAISEGYLLTEGDNTSPYSSSFILNGAGSIAASTVWVNTTGFGSGFPVSLTLGGFIYNGTNFQAYLNGAADGASGTADINAETSIQSYIGTRGDAIVDFFAGKVSEIITYKSDQSANRPAIEANINTYYNIYS
jgi:hypothetical protein